MPRALQLLAPGRAAHPGYAFPKKPPTPQGALQTTTPAGSRRLFVARFPAVVAALDRRLMADIPSGCPSEAT